MMGLPKLISIYTADSFNESGFFIARNLSMASKPINIRYIRTGSKPNWKIRYRIVIYPVF